LARTVEDQGGDARRVGTQQHGLEGTVVHGIRLSHFVPGARAGGITSAANQTNNKESFP
jgi:hypothetical protein